MSSRPPTQKRARHQVYLADALPPSSFPTRTGSPVLIGPHSEGQLMAETDAPLWTGEELTNRRQETSIDTLPDDVLLEIFSYHGDQYNDEFEYKREKAWQTLVHVCRRWRCIVFGSPRHLNLQLVCKIGTRARELLAVWPALPISIAFNGFNQIGSADNIIAALERTNRVCRIELSNIRRLNLKLFLEVMQQPFPELTYLDLWLDGMVAVIPDSFLGGSAPRLQHLELCGIPFTGLPKLLLSATHLVHLRLTSIPHSGYFSPEVMVAALSTLTSLTYFLLEFKTPRSCPDEASRRPPPSTRSVLPVLTYFTFEGVSEYLDDLVACIDAPQLNHLYINLFNDIVFDTPQLVRFISHTPKSKAFKKAYITLDYEGASVRFSSQTSHEREFNVNILCRRLDWQVPSLGQVCTSCLPPLCTLEDVCFYKSASDWEGSVENGQWLGIFRSFIAVKNFYLSEEFASRIAPALEELVEGRTTDVLPALQNNFLKGLGSSGSVQESIGQFVAARQAANHPVGIYPWTV